VAACLFASSAFRFSPALAIIGQDNDYQRPVAGSGRRRIEIMARLTRIEQVLPVTREAE
jgi:hypothetical protein